MDAKTTAWVSYLTLIGWIVAFVQHSNMKEKSSLVVFHLRQMFGLIVLYAAIWILYSTFIFVPGLWSLRWVLQVGLFVLWLIGLLGAVNGEERPVPLLGPLFQQWFQFIK